MNLPTATLPALLTTLTTLTMAVMVLLAVPAVVAASDEVAMTSFSLADMLAPVHDFPASPVPDEQTAHASEAHPASDQALMEQFVRHTFEPGVADLILAQSTYRTGTLNVTGSPALIDHVADVLKRLRAERQTQIYSHLDVVLMDPQLRQRQYALPELAWKDLPGSPGLAYAPLTRAQRAVLTARWSAQAGIGNSLSPSITCFSGQLANCSFKTTCGYPKLTFPASGPAIGMGVLSYGPTLQVRATATDDHRFIHLFMAFDTSSLLQVTTVAMGVKPDGTALTVEEPQVWTTHEQIDQEIEDGASLILTTGLFLERDQPPRAGFLVVTTQVLAPAAAHAMIPRDVQPAPAAPAVQTAPTHSF